jgi:hypothetical protein
MIKPILIKGSLILLFLSIITGCSQGYSELFSETDKFVESLFITYESYGLLGGGEHAVTTSNGLYKITPIGRLVNVRIEKVVSDEEYEKLRNVLVRHYRNDKRVNEVYINQGGTVIIDCRRTE